MATNQELRHASVRAATGTTLNHDGDWLALFAVAGFTTGTFDERLLAYINNQLVASYTSLPAAMQAFAVSHGFNNWSSMGTFTAIGSGLLLEDGTSLLLLESGSFLLLEQA